MDSNLQPTTTRIKSKPTPVKTTKDKEGTEVAPYEWGTSLQVKLALGNNFWYRQSKDRINQNVITYTAIITLQRCNCVSISSLLSHLNILGGYDNNVKLWSPNGEFVFSCEHRASVTCMKQFTDEVGDESKQPTNETNKQASNQQSN